MNYEKIFYSPKLSKLFENLQNVSQFDEQTLVAFEDIFTDINMNFDVKNLKNVENPNFVIFEFDTFAGKQIQVVYVTEQLRQLYFRTYNGELPYRKKFLYVTEINGEQYISQFSDFCSLIYLNLNQSPKLQITKDEEIEMLMKLMNSDSYFSEFFTRDDIRSFVNNIRNDFPIESGTRFDNFGKQF